MVVGVNLIFIVTSNLGVTKCIGFHQKFDQIEVDSKDLITFLHSTLPYYERFFSDFFFFFPLFWLFSFSFLLDTPLQSKYLMEQDTHKHLTLFHFLFLFPLNKPLPLHTSLFLTLINPPLWSNVYLVWWSYSVNKQRNIINKLVSVGFIYFSILFLSHVLTYIYIYIYIYIFFFSFLKMKMKALNITSTLRQTYLQWRDNFLHINEDK